MCMCVYIYIYIYIHIHIHIIPSIRKTREVIMAVFIQQTFKVASRDEEVMIKEPHRRDPDPIHLVNWCL